MFKDDIICLLKLLDATKEANMNFSEKVLNVRAKLDLTQKELGEILHVSTITINRWESGKVCPTKKAMCAFSQLCKDNNITFEEVIS